MEISSNNLEHDVQKLQGGQNNQSLDEAGDEANLDTQFAFGISHPISVSGIPKV